MRKVCGATASYKVEILNKFKISTLYEVAGNAKLPASSLADTAKEPAAPSYSILLHIL